MIDFVDLDVFLPNIQTELARCPEPVIYLRMLEAIIELCEYAPIWRHEGPLIDVRAGVRDYKLNMPTEECEVHSVLGCWYGTRPLEAASHNDLRDMAGKRSTSLREGFYEYSVSRRGDIELFGTPRDDGQEQLRIITSLKPTREAFEVPAEFKSDYFKTIVDGTVGMAMEMVDRKWSNPGEAQKRLRRFFHGKLDARMALDRGQVTGPQRLKRQQFVSNRRFA